MRDYQREILFFGLKLSDIVIFTLSVTLTLLATNQLSLQQNIITSKVSIGCFLLFISLLVTWGGLCNFYCLYSLHRLQRFTTAIGDIAKVVLSSSLIFILTGAVFHLSFLSVKHVFIFACHTSLLTISFRFLLYMLLRQTRTGSQNLRSALVVGTNQTAYSWAETISNSSEFGIKIFGFVDDKIIQQNSKWPYFGKIDSLPTILKENIIDEVVIALPIMSNYALIQRAIFHAEEQGLPVRYTFPLFNTKRSHSQVIRQEDSTISGFMMAQRPYKPWQFITKRTLDVSLATLLLLLLSPLLFMVGLLIKISSTQDPIFFSQIRMGFNKRLFSCYKFRTMVCNAEQLQASLEDRNEMNGAAFKIQNDPRVTTLGRILRKFSIDELPQLLNVIKGDLSLVGPRPLPVRDYERFDQNWQCRRLSVLPGITCTWQISGRNNISFDEWMELDMNYIDNWSLLSDFKILIKTIPAILTARGAR